MSFDDYVKHGWAICAIPPGSKGPRSEGWQLRANAIRDPDHAKRLLGAGLCHAWSGTCALDVDEMERSEEWLAERGIGLHDLLNAPDAVLISSGRSGRAKLLYALPVPLPSLKLCPYDLPDPEKPGKVKKYHGFELRCASAGGETVQDVLPPTVHPMTGRPYEWVCNDDVLGSWRSLPELPPELRQLWEQNLPTAPAVKTVAAPMGAEMARVEKLLSMYDPDCTYEEWIKLGQAIHHETRGSAAGLSAWDAWSQKGDKYGQAMPGQRPQLPADKWGTFRWDATNAVTLGSMLRDEVSAVTDFPLTEPAATASKEFSTDPAHGTDTRPATEIRRALEPLVLVTSQGAYYDRESGSTLSPFTVDHTYTCKMPTVIQTTKAGTKVFTPQPIEELKKASWKHTAYGVGLHPGAGAFFTEQGRKYVNRFTPLDIKPLTPFPRELEAFNFLWTRVDEDIFQRWLLQFFAHAVQKPGVKITSAPIVIGEKTGSGKNTLMKILPQLLFTPRWVTIMTNEVLRGTFNDKLGEAWWVYFEELHAGAAKADRVRITTRVRSWITDDTFEVHPKGGKPYDMPNRIQITATSNYDDAIHLDNNDRRWTVGHIPREMSVEEGVALYEFLKSERAPGVLQHIFRNVSISGFQPTARAPMTRSKHIMIQAGLGGWESTIMELMASGEQPFHRDLFEIRDVLPYVSAHGLTLNRLSRLLKTSPFNCVAMDPCNNLRLMAWRNGALWARESGADRVKYRDSGTRPTGPAWSDDLPKALADMMDDPVAIPAEIPDSCKGLI